MDVESQPIQKVTEQQILEHPILEQKPKKCLGSLCNLHNLSRLVAVSLALSCLLILASFWNGQLKLDNVQLVCLYASIFSTFPLLFGTFFSIHVLYVPAVYIMRLLMIKLMVYNIYFIVRLSSEVDTFARESALRSKAETVFFMNRNFGLLKDCFKFTIQTWICLFVFGILQFVISKDYFRLRNKESEMFGAKSRITRITNWRSHTLFRRRRANQPVKDDFDLDGDVVTLKKQVAASEPIPSNEEHHATINETASEPGNIGNGVPQYDVQQQQQMYDALEANNKQKASSNP